MVNDYFEKFMVVDKELLMFDLKESCFVVYDWVGVKLDMVWCWFDIYL